MLQNSCMAYDLQQRQAMAAAVVGGSAVRAELNETARQSIRCPASVQQLVKAEAALLS
jgi:hypothetical protein